MNTPINGEGHVGVPRGLSSALALALTLFSAAVLVGCGGESTEAAAGADEMEEMDHSDHGDDHDHGDDRDHGDDHGHHHGEVVEVPEGMAVPAVELEAVADARKGANISISLTDFEISPENASTDPVDGQGHMHLYVDGERVMRFYNTDLHLGNLEPGEREIMVELSANNHSAYGVDGEAIRATATVEVPDHDAAGDGDHAMSHGEGVAADEPVPAISIEVSEDPKSGHNVAIDVTNFTITPANVNTDHVDGEGHLHLYVDGERQGRLYGLDTHISGLKAGTHEIMVELSANDHSVYMNGDEPIAAVATVEVAG